jgi:hypothetical protein
MLFIIYFHLAILFSKLRNFNFLIFLIRVEFHEWLRKLFDELTIMFLLSILINIQILYRIFIIIESNWVFIALKCSIKLIFTIYLLILIPFNKILKKYVISWLILSIWFVIIWWYICRVFFLSIGKSRLIVMMRKNSLRKNSFSGYIFYFDLFVLRNLMGSFGKLLISLCKKLWLWNNLTMNGSKPCIF